MSQQSVLFSSDLELGETVQLVMDEVDRIQPSCVVFDMPKEAIKAGAVDKVLPLDDIADAILAHVSR